MSLSRLSGLVVLLVLGTALSVWWYLQVPAAAKAPPGPVAVEEALEPEPRGEAAEVQLDVRGTPGSTAVPASDRWTRRVRPAGTASTGARSTRESSGSAEAQVEEAGVKRPCARSSPCETEPAAAAVQAPGP